MKKQVLTSVICFLFSSTLLFAGGFHLNLQGQKQLGMAHCGTASVTDASSLFFNPGTLSFLDSMNSICAGSSFLFPRLVYVEPTPGVYTSELVHNTSTPLSFYAAFRFKKSYKWNVGIGIYTPFGSHAQWQDDWKGQFLVREIELRSFFIQPTFSYKLNEHIGIGVGYVFAQGDFYLRKGMPLQNIDGSYGEATLSGKARSNGGFNTGIYTRFQKWSFGLDYRSAVTLNIANGQAEFVNVPTYLAAYFENTPFSTHITLPSVTSAGISYTGFEKWKLLADVNYVGWKSYDTLSIDFETNSDKLADVHSPRSYVNSFIYRLGAQYSAGTQTQLRAGAYFDQSPVQAGFVSPESPDMNKLGFTAGASFFLGKFLVADLSFLWVEGLKRTDINLESGFGGTYKVRALAPGAGIEYRF
jgi:long-chain fatty acid transport protein